MVSGLSTALLRVYHSQSDKFHSSDTLLKFSHEYGIGRARGLSVLFSKNDKTRIAKLLLSQWVISADTAKHSDFAGMTRSECLRAANNEKLFGLGVSNGRVMLKSSSGYALTVAGGCWYMPNRADMRIDLSDVLTHHIGHDALLVVENMQTFDDFWSVDCCVTGSVPCINPLVVYRGDAQSGARVDAVHELIESTAIPVYAFVDYDPTGMLIAGGLPRLDGLLTPPLDYLESMLSRYGIASRFTEQVVGPHNRLNELLWDSIIGPVWRVIRCSKKALPQEIFHRSA